MGWQEGYDHRSISSFFPNISCLCRFTERLGSRYLGFIFGGAVMILPGPFPWGCQTSRRCQLPVEELPSVPVASGRRIKNRVCLVIVFYFRAGATSFICPGTGPFSRNNALVVPGEQFISCQSPLISPELHSVGPPPLYFQWNRHDLVTG